MSIARWLPVCFALACASEANLNLSRNLAGVDGVPGLEPTVVEDVLRQRVPDALDVLWVVDNSQSMLAEQKKIAQNAGRVLDYWKDSGLDWRVGVITTDMVDPAHMGRLQAAGDALWVDQSTPKPVDTFREMIVVGRDGAVVERGRAAILSALSTPAVVEHNAGFYRRTAHLAIIIVSDEDDGSGTAPAMSEFVGWLNGLKASRDMVTVSAIVSLDEPCGQNKEGVEYRELVRFMGGTEYDICESNWAPLLGDLGIDAAGLDQAFFLSRLPIASTIQVEVDDRGDVRSFAPETDFVYDPSRNAIVFTSYTPPAAAEVHVTYEVAEASVTP